MFLLWIMASVFVAHAADDKYLQHPEKCDLFYSVDVCPPDEHFDANEKVCKPAELVKCKITGGDATSPVSPSGRLLTIFSHPNSCEKYYRINFCEENFNFNPATNACDYPKDKGCPNATTGCAKLDPFPDVDMTPERCTKGDNKIGDVCKIDCKKPLQAKGTTFFICTEAGWKTEGTYVPPQCVEPVAVVQDLVDDMVEKLENVDAEILFVVDESGSLTASNFDKEKLFIKGLIGRLPLSENRTAGVILFSDKSRLAISLETKDTCSFYKQVENMRYQGGGTNIRLALETAKNELINTDPKKKALVLLTDGQSPNATEVAQELKNEGATIFTIGVTGYDEVALMAIASGNENETYFYPVYEQRGLDSIVDYLKNAYIANMTANCEQSGK